MKLLSIAALTGVVVSSAQASLYDPAPVKLTDGFSVVPQLDAVTYYNDNIYSTETDEASSLIYIVTPSILFGVDDGINRYGGNYELISGSYSYDDADNYLDQKLSLFAHTEYTDKHRTDFGFKFSDLHEARGSNLTEGQPLEYPTPLEYNTYVADGYYQYGAQTAIINVGGGVQYYLKEYTNYTNDTKYDDLSSWTLKLDVDYQVGSVTYFTADLSRANEVYKYQEPGVASKDNTDGRITVGARWEGLGKTVGKAKVGYQLKTFQDSSRENFAGYIVDIGVAWSPLQHSVYEAHVSRAAEDSNTAGDYILASTGAFNWSHNWTEKLDSDVILVYTHEDYVGATRIDQTANVGLYINYEFTRWFKMRTGYEYTKKGSTAPNIRYDQNAINLGLTVAL
ncbi:outer membrane beta-barrel protein [Psychromonas sp.]|nr:outer membrane beta-barrel protein [Psychromonas sp.]